MVNEKLNLSNKNKKKDYIKRDRLADISAVLFYIQLFLFMEFNKNVDKLRQISTFIYIQPLTRNKYMQMECQPGSTFISAL